MCSSWIQLVSKIIWIYCNNNKQSNWKKVYCLVAANNSFRKKTLCGKNKSLKSDYLRMGQDKNWVDNLLNDWQRKLWDLNEKDWVRKLNENVYQGLHVFIWKLNDFVVAVVVLLVGEVVVIAVVDVVVVLDVVLELVGGVSRGGARPNVEGLCKPAPALM